MRSQFSYANARRIHIFQYGYFYPLVSSLDARLSMCFFARLNSVAYQSFLTLSTFLREIYVIIEKIRDRIKFQITSMTVIKCKYRNQITSLMKLQF